MPKIETKDCTGKPNGYVIPIWNAVLQPDLRPDQVYVTAVAPGCRKGPHLHMKRRGLFCCVHGIIRLRVRAAEGLYSDSYLSPGKDPVMVPPGVPAAIYNQGREEALLLNMPAPAWSAEDPDEWPVENWID